MNDLNFDDFLSSQIPEEIVFAILCDFRGEQPEHIRLYLGIFCVHGTFVFFR